MKIMSKVNAAKAAFVTGLMTVATSSYAGAVAEAVSSATGDFKSDLTAVGGIAVGLGLVGIAFIAAVRLIKRAV